MFFVHTYILMYIFTYIYIYIYIYIYTDLFILRRYIHYYIIRTPQRIHLQTLLRRAPCGAQALAAALRGAGDALKRVRKEVRKGA